MIKIFGIKNCDTMKKAFRWLDENHIDYVFHDYKKTPLDESKAKAWIEQLGWENIINKRGTTWRKLDDETKHSMNDQTAIATIINQTSMIKRPLIEADEQLILGFKAEDYAEHFIKPSSST